jgi:RNA polymerase sigma-70 factor (ECF subfamily)
MLYRRLMAVSPSPVIELNRAVAVAMAGGPAAGLAIVQTIEAQGTLDGYHFLPAVKGHLLRLLERWDEAADAYRAALTLPANGVERRHVERRLAEVLERAGQRQPAV